jgi:hypothetical protein
MKGWLLKLSVKIRKHLGVPQKRDDLAPSQGTVGSRTKKEADLSIDCTSCDFVLQFLKDL